MEITAFFIFAGALAISAGSPGPSIAALVAQVLSNGYRDVLPFLAAMWIGEAIWLTLAVWGLASLADAFQMAFYFLKWAGVLYLLYLAWKMWTAPLSFTSSDLPENRSPLKMFATGLAITLGNPKIMVFYVALLPTIVDLANLTLVDWFVLTTIMLKVLIAVDLAWVLFATHARAMLKSQGAVRVANRCGAAVMVGAATAIASR